MVHGVRGVWLNMFHVFLASLLCAPSGWGVVVEPCNFWVFASHLMLACLWVLVFGVFLVGYWAFHGLFLSETFFVESLILAQDERWRRA